MENKPILNNISISSGAESIGITWVSSGNTLADLDHALHTLSTMKEVLTRIVDEKADKDNEDNADTPVVERPVPDNSNPCENSLGAVRSKRGF